MDRDLLMMTMKASISEVLEKMFFLPLDVSDAVDWSELWEDPTALDPIAVRLAFSGPFSGHFLFLVPRGLGTGLTADFMGIEKKAVPPEHVEQTAKEILNMVAGTTFSDLVGQAIFQLGIPETVSAETALVQSTSPDNEVFLGVETLQGRMGLLLVNG
ncbi:MAG: chemotaxis protein CheX [Thermodesulfobacteriota bacterium]